jgi:hypothetical protein
MAGMFESVVRVGISLLAVYSLVGTIFAIVFLVLGVTRIDEEAKGSGIAFRLLIAPGVVIFWPSLLVRWLRRKGPSTERNAHRCSAR